MRKIGLIGGTGWVSTLEYYRLINRMVNARLGGLNSAQCLLYSFNYAEIATLNQSNDHEGVLRMVTDAAKRLEIAGVDCIALCANTLHFYADDLQAKISKPIIHIATATANEIRAKGLSKVGLLGTRMTMEEDFYKTRLSESGIEAIVPDDRGRAFVHRTIFNELIKDIFLDKTRAQLIDIIKKLQVQGAEGIILGCTEIPLLINQSDTNVTLFNTLEIHAKAIAEFAVE
ncbi:MAG: aspartate/glutamate racemase family protein [Bacteroidales bacterium]|nr:MAG: aspartate/glutamate racemase family protein [Bacteroidales bacterium]